MLLAGGGSSRLGRPKQLLKFEGETLLRRAARALAESVYFPIVVVLGADAEMGEPELSGLPVYSVFNERWTDGMSTSLRVGLSRILELEPGADGVIIALCDQPFVTTEMLDRFACKFHEANAPIVSAGYNEVSGVPALFSKDLFEELFNLNGDQGARQVIRNSYNVYTIDVPEAAVDIDTEDDAVRFGITNRE